MATWYFCHASWSNKNVCLVLGAWAKSRLADIHHSNIWWRRTQQQCCWQFYDSWHSVQNQSECMFNHRMPMHVYHHFALQFVHKFPNLKFSGHFQGPTSPNPKTHHEKTSPPVLCLAVKFCMPNAVQCTSRSTWLWPTRHCLTTSGRFAWQKMPPKKMDDKNGFGQNLQEKNSVRFQCFLVDHHFKLNQ